MLCCGPHILTSAAWGLVLGSFESWTVCEAKVFTVEGLGLFVLGSFESITVGVLDSYTLKCPKNNSSVQISEERLGLR